MQDLALFVLKCPFGSTAVFVPIRRRQLPSNGCECMSAFLDVPRRPKAI